MADIINLRRARKRAMREAAGAKGQENRVLFGRTKAERELGRATRVLADRALEAHRLVAAEGSGDDPERGDD